MLLRLLRKATQELDLIQQKMEKLMATAQDFKTAIAAIDTETNRIAAKIQDLLSQIGAGGLTDEEEQQALADINAAAERLKAIGADPSNPVPPVV